MLAATVEVEFMSVGGGVGVVLESGAGVAVGAAGAGVGLMVPAPSAPVWAPTDWGGVTAPGDTAGDIAGCVLSGMVTDD